MYFYHAFGMHLASDLVMPELLIDQTGAAPDVVIHAGETPDFLNAQMVNNSLMQGDAQQLLFEIPAAARFFVQQGREITYSHVQIDTDSLRLFILGSGLGALLQQRGYIVLHGNAVSTNKENCTIFVGHRGAGKSTTAAYYFQQGAYILSDDVCAVTFDAQGKPIVIPSFPQIKLWQDAADLLGISTQGLRRIRPQDTKFSYRIEERFCRQALPLTRIVEIENNILKTGLMSGMDKLKLLVAHSYRYQFLETMRLSNQHAKLLLQLINQVELKTMHRADIIKSYCQV